MISRLRGKLKLTKHSSRDASQPETATPVRCPASPHDRHHASTALCSADVAHRVWLEDVLVAYGSDTQVWDLVILVEKPHNALKALQKSGYTQSTPISKFADDPEFCGKGMSVVLPESETKVMLYAAKDWFYELAPGVSGIPPLNEFLDSLMGMWLNISLQDYVDRLPFALDMASLITYCYKLTDPQNGVVKSLDYAVHLKEEHRQLHFDIVEPGAKVSFATTSNHTYHVRKSAEIKAGDWEPRANIVGHYQPQLSAIGEANDSL